MTGLTNDYLEKLTKRLMKKRKFVGVFAANEVLNVNERHPFSIIFNTGRVGTPGLHFVAVFVTRTSVYYFDSFGEETIQQDISKFIKKLNKPCVMLCQAIQHRKSNFCGFYALAFLIWMSVKKKKPQSFYSLFSYSDLRENDNIVTRFILNEIK